MGHIRLGRLPRTRRWQRVVALLGAGADTPDIAAATLIASKRGLEGAARDPALVQSFWLLTQLPLCARNSDFVGELKKVGIWVGNEPSVMDLIGGLSDAVDDHVHRTGGRTDLGEMAQMGAAESLSRLLNEKTETLFGSTPEDVQRQLSNLGTPRNFSYLAREFFARLTERYVAYFLSRELSIQLGSVSANHQFREALSLHCRQASKIVETYAAEWYSKANYQGGISVKKASEFVRYALKKLRAELQMGAGN